MALGTPALQQTSSGGGGGNSTIISPIGQKAMASSVSVVIASDQTPIQVVGNVPAGSTDSGNGVKISGVFYSSLPTLTNGQRGDLALDSTSRLFVNVNNIPGFQIFDTGFGNKGNQVIIGDNTNTLTVVTAGADGNSNTVNTLPTYNYLNIFNGATWDRMPGDKTNGVFVNIKSSSATFIATGNLTNNNAAPSTNNMGVLPAIANASAPTFTEGDQVLLSTDLSGSTRVKQQDSITTGNLTSTTSITATLNGASVIGINVSGTWSATLQFEASIDGSTFFNVQADQQNGPGYSSNYSQNTTSNGQWVVPVGGYNKFRVRCSAYTSGTATITLQASLGASFVYLNTPNTPTVNVGNFAIGTFGNNDGASAGITSALTFSENLVFNGTTWDRLRSASAGQGTTGTGVGGSAMLVWDGTNYQRVTVNSTTFSSKFGADVNLLGTLGTAFTTAGLVDIKGTDGNVFVRNATAANFLATVSIASSQTLATVTNVAQLNGVGPTFNSTATSGKQGLDVNVLSILGTAPTTAGFIDIKGADGNVFVRQATAANLNAQVVGSTASGSSVSGNPVQIGTYAATALPTAVSGGQVVEVMSDKFGRLVVIPNAMRDLVVPITSLTITSSTSETTLITQVGSTFLDLVSLSVINTSTTPTQVDFRDSTGGTIRFSVYVPAGDMRGVSFTVPLPQNAVNNNWTAKCGTSVASVIITGHYITNK